ncbi:pyrimidine reductase [Rhizocola hellebori]|uniref:Pyrimidine reductase n=1 Tax=Rhizocola hellebori TaxID=1392758 RepID=A0A8J3VHT0_9ACTN|nr:dihydrofolate reductase family protein [Rhizocola hellebori]GIH06820.1 pyrimidine reductase [Rhizocola hellebori]
MRKIVAGLFISLDGVVEAPQNWHFPYFNDEMGQAVGEQMGGAEAMLLGRVTYDEFASYWPHQDPDGEMVAQMNNTPKYVVSTTLSNPEWQNTTVIGLDELAKLKQEPGGDLGMSGSPTLVRSLLRAGLLDELRLLVHPIVVGSGKRLFPDGSDSQPLKLLDSKTFETGVMYLTYGPA